ncbi:MAG TPA: hypothetical protein VGI83_08640, partial [Gemmatimonadales bacterium]
MTRTRLVAVGSLLAAAACHDEPTRPAPPPPTIAKVVITPALDTLTYLQETVQLIAVAVDTNGDSIPGKTFVWKSAAPAAVKVDSATGFARALGNGPIVVTATALPDSVDGTTTVVVSQVPVRLTFALQPAGAVEG